MTLIESMLSEFDAEAASTRKTLERVPEDAFGWKPHEKSFSVGELATHLANIPSWVSYILEQDSFDIMPGGVEPPHLQSAASRDELLDQFDTNIARSRAALTGVDDVRLSQPWTLLSNDFAVFTEPRFAVLRSIIFNHTVHHRAQLGLCFRLLDVPVPSTYGPSADESM